MPDYDVIAIEQPAVPLAAGHEFWGTDAEFVGAAGAASPARPQVINFVPALGSKIGRYDPVQFDVIDEGPLSALVLIVSFDARQVTEVVYASALRGLYASSSTVAEIPGGYRFNVRRGSGWPTRPSFEVFAVDAEGNINI